MFQFDPTAIEALITAVLTLLGLGVGTGIRRGRRTATAEHATAQLSTLTQQLGTLAEQQTATTTKLTEIVTKLDNFVEKDLARVERQQRKLAGDVDAIGDAVDVLVTHVGEQLPDGARASITGKLQRRQQHEVTGVMVRR